MPTSQNTFKLPNGWAFALPDLPPSDSLPHDDVERAVAETVPAAELVSFNQRFSQFQARGAFTDHPGTTRALGILNSRIDALLDTAPNLRESAGRRELTLGELWRNRDLSVGDRAELLELGRASRSDKAVRTAILGSLTRRDADAHERQLQVSFLRSALSVVFGPEGSKARDVFFQRLHTAKAIEQMKPDSRENMERETVRRRADVRSFRGGTINTSDRDEFFLLAAAVRGDKDALSEALKMLTRPDPNDPERRLQAVFFHTNPAILGSEGVRAHASMVQRLEREAVAELQACVELQAAIVRAGDAGHSLIRNVRAPADWSDETRAWLASAGDLKRIETVFASAIAEARAHQPCPQCRGDRTWRNYNSSSWETCGLCWGTGTADKAEIDRAKKYGVKAQG